MIEIINDNYIIYSLIITALSVGLLISGKPFGLFKYKIQKIDIFYIVNMMFISMFCFLMVKIFLKNWIFGLTANNFINGVFLNGFPVFICSLIVFILSYKALKPINRNPEKRILFWIFVHFLFGALVEELIFRGVLLNTLLKAFDKKIILAVIISSIIFGLIHLIGISIKNIKMILIRIVETGCYGIFFSSIYIVSGNLLSVIVLHWVFNISGSILYYYTNSNKDYPLKNIYYIIAIILFIWGIYLLKDYIK
jgi:membrane protease YdiL (CAAX protease family)